MRYGVEGSDGKIGRNVGGWGGWLQASEDNSRWSGEKTGKEGVGFGGIEKKMKTVDEERKKEQMGRVYACMVSGVTAFGSMSDDDRQEDLRIPLQF